MINAGNPSAHNLQMRKYVKEHKQSSSQIFEKLNRRRFQGSKSKTLSTKEKFDEIHNQFKKLKDLI